MTMHKSQIRPAVLCYLAGAGLAITPGLMSNQHLLEGSIVAAVAGTIIYGVTHWEYIKDKFCNAIPWCPRNRAHA